MKKLFFVILLSGVVGTLCAEGLTRNSVPAIGAQVFIEPGQQPEQIDAWFATLRDCDMRLCRIRMFEKYMRTTDGAWDFSLFDQAFCAADRYGIAVYATLFPDTEFLDVGGFKFPHTREHQMKVAEYVRQVVKHFSQYDCLVAWVLINEPGSPEMPFEELFTQNHFVEWKKEQAESGRNSAGWYVPAFERDRFSVDYHSWYLGWLAEQVRSVDREHDLHVNPHNVFRLYGYYDFPAWRSFLASLGGSAHASWHFGYFSRNRYPVAMSANAELLRSGAGELPWLMTELQGGNNLYSGADPMCPTPEEITQWLWINLATEAKGGIFWCLNSRASGTEAGEWAMVDFLNCPSERMQAAAKVARFVNEHADDMAEIRTARSGITVLYNRESSWVEKLQTRSRKNGDARSDGASMCSTLAWFETLSHMGLQADFREFREFDFRQEDYAGEVLILSHQIALDASMINCLEHFVDHGGILIADGLTGFYDTNAHSTVVSGFALERLFGAVPVEFKYVAKNFLLPLADRKLPCNLWRGTLQLRTAEALAFYDDEPIAVVNHYGRGRVIWIPSPIGLGARDSGNYAPLAAWLQEQLPNETLNRNPCFANFQPAMILKNFYCGDTLYTLIVNKSNQKEEIPLTGLDGRSGSLYFADNAVEIGLDRVTIEAEGTAVLCWK